MYDDLARTQRPSPLEWLVVNVVIPSITLSIVLRTWGSDGLPSVTLRDGNITSEIIPAVTAPAPADLPLLVSIRHPEYPIALRRAGIEGRVVMRALVDMHGRVRDSSIEVVQTADSRLDAPARRAIRSALFVRPGAGLPVESWVSMAIEFHLFPE